MHLRDIVGNGTQGRHGPEGNTTEVHVETSDDDAHPTISQLVADIHQSHIEELSFIDAHHLNIRR